MTGFLLAFCAFVGGIGVASASIEWSMAKPWQRSAAIAAVYLGLAAVVWWVS
jgi:hypothetical protein